MSSLNPFPIIWTSEPARVELPAPADAAFASMRARLRGWPPRLWFKEGCLGLVSDTRVRLQHYRPLRRNDFSPVLDATLVAQGGPPVLEGVYRASWTTRIFLTLWFGIAIALIPTFFLAGALSLWPRDRATAVVFMLAPTAFFLIGRTGLAINRRHWEADKAWLQRFVADSKQAAERA